MVLGIFSFFLIIEYFIHISLVSTRRTFSAIGNRRSLILLEMIPNTMFVKANAMEDYFEKRLKTMRKEEILKMKKLHLFSSIANFFYETLPIICSVIIIGSYSRLNNGKSLQPSTAFSLVAILKLLASPLRLISEAIDNFWNYKRASKCYEEYYEGVEDKPSGHLDGNI